MNSVISSIKLVCWICIINSMLPRVAEADLLVGDYNNHQIWRFTDSGTLLGPFGDANDAHGLGIPAGIARDAEGRIYTKSMTSGNVLRFDPLGNYLGQWIDGGTGTQAGLAFDSHGNLWFRRLGFGSPPAYSSRMGRFDAGGKLDFEFDTRLAGYGPFAIDSGDILYVPHDEVYSPPIFPGDAFDGVYRFRTDGTPLGPFGQATNALSGIVNPEGVLFDSHGHLLVGVVGRILKYDVDGTFLGTFAISDTSGYMAMDAVGNIYGASGPEVFKFDSAGNPLGEIIRAGVGGVPANFRSEAIAYVPPVPEAAGAALATFIVLGYLVRRRQRPTETERRTDARTL